MHKVPEGIRRLGILLGIVAAVGWVIFIATVSDGFESIQPAGWVIFLLGIPAAFGVVFLELERRRPGHYESSGRYSLLGCVGGRQLFEGRSAAHQRRRPEGTACPRPAVPPGPSELVRARSRRSLCAFCFRATKLLRAGHDPVRCR